MVWLLTLEWCDEYLTWSVSDDQNIDHMLKGKSRAPQSANYFYWINSSTVSGTIQGTGGTQKWRHKMFVSSLQDKINMLCQLIIIIIIQREMLKRDTKNLIPCTSWQSAPGGCTFTLRQYRKQPEVRQILRSEHPQIRSFYFTILNQPVYQFLKEIVLTSSWFKLISLFQRVLQVQKS